MIKSEQLQWDKNSNEVHITEKMKYERKNMNWNTYIAYVNFYFSLEKFFLEKNAGEVLNNHFGLIKLF